MRYAAFLRGMNVGGHRLTNAALCGHFEALGFKDVSAFLTSGNVVFDAGRKANVAARIEKGLREKLGYDVPTILRTGAEVCAVADREVFSPDLVAARGKEHVWFLADRPSPSVAREVLALATENDLLKIVDRELHWLPRGGVLESDLKMDTVTRIVGTATARTRNTVARMAKKYFRS